MKKKKQWRHLESSNVDLSLQNSRSSDHSICANMAGQDDFFSIDTTGKQEKNSKKFKGFFKRLANNDSTDNSHRIWKKNGKSKNRCKRMKNGETYVDKFCPGLNLELDKKNHRHYGSVKPKKTGRIANLDEVYDLWLDNIPRKNNKGTHNNPIKNPGLIKKSNEISYSISANSSQSYNPAMEIYENSAFLSVSDQLKSREEAIRRQNKVFLPMTSELMELFPSEDVLKMSDEDKQKAILMIHQGCKVSIDQNGSLVEVHDNHESSAGNAIYDSSIDRDKNISLKLKNNKTSDCKILEGNRFKDIYENNDEPSDEDCKKYVENSPLTTLKNKSLGKKKTKAQKNRIIRRKLLEKSIRNNRHLTGYLRSFDNIDKYTNEINRLEKKKRIISLSRIKRKNGSSSRMARKLLKYSGQYTRILPRDELRGTLISVHNPFSVISDQVNLVYRRHLV